MDKDIYFKKFIEIFDTNKPNEPPKEDRFRLTKGECAILRALLFENRGVTPSELSANLKVGSSRIANALKTLERKKYIKRVINPDDKRKTLVYIQEKGKNYIQKIEYDATETIYYIATKMGDAKFDEYIKLMKEFIYYFNQYIEEKKLKEAKND